MILLFNSNQARKKIILYCVTEAQVLSAVLKYTSKSLWPSLTLLTSYKTDNNHLDVFQIPTALSIVKKLFLSSDNNFKLNSTVCSLSYSLSQTTRYFHLRIAENKKALKYSMLHHCYTRSALKLKITVVSGKQKLRIAFRFIRKSIKPKDLLTPSSR